MSERLSRREVKAKRARLQGRIKLSKTELSKIRPVKCELCGSSGWQVPETGMCYRCNGLDIHGRRLNA